MSEAFQCDRCGDVVPKAPRRYWGFSMVPWSTTDKELCDDCNEDMMEAWNNP